MTVTGQYSWSQTFKGKQALLGDLYGYLPRCWRRPPHHSAEFIADGDYVVVEARGEW